MSLLQQPGGFEGVGAMAEELDLAHLPVSDREDLKEVDHYRDAAFPPSATLANYAQDAPTRRLDELKRLLREVNPPVPKLLVERDDLWDTPKMLRGVGVRLLVMPVQLDLRVESFRIGVPGQFTPHECVEAVDKLAGDLDALRRHRSQYRALG